MRDYLHALSLEDRVAVASAMHWAETGGARAGRHIRGDIYEIRAVARNGAHRILFAEEGRRRQVLLTLHAFRKQTTKTPPREIELAERRLADWRWRGRR